MWSATWRWTAVAAALVLVVPSLASAERRSERRALPGGSRASSAPSTGERAEDPAVAAAVDRLRAGRSGAGPTVARAAGGASADDLVVRSRRGHVKALSASPDEPFYATRPGTDRSPSGLALSFLREHRVAFGWSRERATLRSRAVRRSGERSYVRLEQRLNDLPVFGAGAVVQVDSSGGVAFVLADLARDDSAAHSPAFSFEAVLSGVDARREAVDAVPAERQAPDLAAGAAVLMVYEPSVIGEAGSARLVWHVRVRSATEAVDEIVLVDAMTGDVTFQFSQIKDAKNRTVYDLNGTTTPPPTPTRAEGDVAVVTPVDVDLAYDYLGDTYDFYATLGRDSFDNAGAGLVAHVRYASIANAFWDGSKMVFGPGYAAADDVVAHELTHAVTENESNLIYWGESGAINEALSDIFGELVDQGNGAGTDGAGVDWLMGEDLPGLPGGIRNMADPTAFGDPDRRYSPNWWQSAADNRGVHTNSGVANKLAYLLTDGGAFNGETVAALGSTEVAKLFYEAQAHLLVSGSDYFDLYAALRQAAVNLGWDTAARSTLAAACRAVEIHAGDSVVTILADGFEGSLNNWQIIEQSVPCGPEGSETPAGKAAWGSTTYRAASGARSLYAGAGGASPAPVGGPYKSCMDTWVVYGPFSLDAVSAAWAEFDLYLDIEPLYGDDIFWGVSTHGTLCPDGNPGAGGECFDGYAVQPPNGCTGTCPPWGQPFWAREMFNFGEIESPAVVGRQQVWLAFNFVSDEEVEYEGAYIDNVGIKKAFDAQVEVTSPNGDESWPIGSLQQLKWTTQGLQPSHSVKVSLVDGGSPTEIATLGYDQKSYVWKVAGSVTSAARIRVECVGCSVPVSDDSDADFSLTAAVTGQPARHDWNGDDKPDLLWHNQAGGDLYVWLMNGVVKSSGSYLTPSKIANTAWQIRGLADFNADGHLDILWHNQKGGDLYVWFMDDLDQGWGSYLSPSKFSNTAWQIRGVGDFNGDDKVDILWHNQVTGYLYVWYLNGLSQVGGSYLAPARITNTAWKIKGVADFDDDGDLDILWHNQKGGDLYVWFMNGVSLQSGSYLTPPSFSNTAWQIRELADFNGDDKIDILWHNQVTGHLYVWYLNGLSKIGGSYLTPNSITNTSWQISPR